MPPTTLAAPLTADGYTRARRVLMRRDPILGAAIKRIGPCGMADRQKTDHLSTLVSAIVSQQLSTKAAATIFGRFVALFPEGQIPHAGAIAALGQPELRAVGLSGQKVAYLRDLCARITDGRLNLSELDSLPDELDRDAFKGSLNDLLERKRKRPRMSSASVSAVDLPKAIARILGPKHAGPWLLITEICFTDRGEPVIFARDYHRGDSFSFNFSRR